MLHCKRTSIGITYEAGDCGAVQMSWIYFETCNKGERQAPFEHLKGNLGSRSWQLLAYQDVSTLERWLVSHGPQITAYRVQAVLTLWSVIGSEEFLHMAKRIQRVIPYFGSSGELYLKGPAISPDDVDIILMVTASFANNSEAENLPRYQTTSFFCKSVVRSSSHGTYPFANILRLVVDW
jgi:hypothetical protein